MAVLIVAVLLRILRGFFRPPTNTDTLEDYLRRHPKCRKNGRVFCYRCGSSSIYLYRWGYGRGWIQNLHICRQCGTKLYQSTVET